MAEDRLTLLCEQDPAVITGIDFIEVVDPLTLRVFFIVDPGTTTPALTDALIDPADVAIYAPSGGRRVAEVEVASTSWVLIDGRNALALTLTSTGDWSRYRLRIDDGQIDHFFNDVEFSFKQGCPSRLDAKPRPDEAESGPPPLRIDPAARDFASMRRALLDAAAQSFPEWTYESDADVGVTLIELMAALGDEMSYVLDRFTRERNLETLSQRRSLRHVTRMLDYELHDGLSPSTLLRLTVSAPVEIPAGLRFWASRLGEAPIPFEVGEGLADLRADEGEPKTWQADDAWQSLAVYEGDGAQPTIPKGATELLLDGHIPGAQDWTAQGRWIVVREVSDGVTRSCHLAVVTEVDFLTFALDAADVTRVRFGDAQSLPSAVTIADAIVDANVVPATAGQTYEERFRVRGEGPWPEAVEREGPLDADAGQRSLTLLYSPLQTEGSGLGWIGELRSSTPELELWEIDAEDLEPIRPWQWRRSLLSSLPNDPHFSLDDGTWRRIRGFRTPTGERLEHRDWAANAGYTIRFGDGEFGLTPADGAVFHVRYRSGPGAAANVASETIVLLSDPDSEDPPAEPLVTGVSNPLAVTSGAAPEDALRAKLFAPETVRGQTYYAVRPEDYAQIAETLPWVQRASASQRWTGSYLSVRVAVDPRGRFALTEQLREELSLLLDRSRQLGHEVVVLEPDYIDVDLDVELLISPGSYAGQVEAEVTRRLSGEGGFFSPDNFTFGTSLQRAALESATLEVSGVVAVTEVRVRARELVDWHVFEELILTPGEGQVLRLQNDPQLPERGSLRVRAREGCAAS